MTDYTSWGQSELIEELQRRDRAREALLNIFDYLNEQERSDYDSYHPEEVQANHIYHDVRKLGDLLGLDMRLN